MRHGLKMFQVMRAERIVDCYAGDTCDQHRALFHTYCEGDKDSDETDEPLVLDPKLFPAGSRVIVEIPMCPECHEPQEVCRCGFDWKKWAEEIYS